MIHLRDIKEKKNIKNIVLGLSFGTIGVLIQFYSVPYNLPLSIVTFLISSFFFISTTRLTKSFEGEFTDKIKISDSIDIIVFDKEGKIKNKVHNN